MSAEAILGTAIQAAVQNLPTLGDANSKDVLVLAHYSEDPGIAAFRESIKFSWTKQTPAAPEAIYTFIQKFSVEFKCIYVVKLGIGSAYRTLVHDGGGGRVEHAIDLALTSGDFGAVLITFDPATRAYFP